LGAFLCFGSWAHSGLVVFADVVAVHYPPVKVIKKLETPMCLPGDDHVTWGFMINL